jgi:hypothetical protein
MENVCHKKHGVKGVHGSASSIRHWERVREGTLKNRRRRPEGGEWELIKILHRNLAYVSNRTQRVSLLTRSRPHSYRQAIGPRNLVRQP